MEKLRVVQWATGKVGQFTLRAILDDPRLELVGVYAYSADKVGKDAGDLCSRPQCGVTAINSLEEILALDADAVIYAPMLAEVAPVCQLLEAGVNVISTNLFSNVGGIEGDVKNQLASACERGNSSLCITGVHPGWANSMAVAMAGVCRRVDCVSLYESADCSIYHSAETWLSLGFSKPKATEEVVRIARGSLLSFADSTRAMAEAMALSLDELRFTVEYAKAVETVDLGWFSMDKGTIAAIRGGWDGIVDGRTVVRTRVAWYLTDKLDTDWEFHDENYRVVVDGDPGVDCRVFFKEPPYWGADETLITTALPAVNALLNVKAAPSGILSLHEIGLVTAPAGVWGRK